MRGSERQTLCSKGGAGRHRKHAWLTSQFWEKSAQSSGAKECQLTLCNWVQRRGLIMSDVMPSSKVFGLLSSNHTLVLIHSNLRLPFFYFHFFLLSLLFMLGTFLRKIFSLHLLIKKDMRMPSVKRPCWMTHKEHMTTMNYSDWCPSDGSVHTVVECSAPAWLQGKRRFCCLRAVGNKEHFTSDLQACIP